MALVPPYIESLPVYETGRHIEDVKRAYGLTEVIKLASNENPWGSSPRAVEAVRGHLEGLNRYPNSGADLKAVLAERFRCRAENVVVGNGSEGIMATIFRTFLGDNDEVLTTESAFVGFQRLARSRGVAYRTVPYRDWRFDLEGLGSAITERTKVIYLTNPNNPTGTIFTQAEFDRFYARVPQRVLIIYDEAYYEYGAGAPGFPDSMVYRYDNVITLRTFSKAYGLAGFRVGYGFAHEDLIRNLEKVKLPFEPATLSQVAAIAALDDEDFIRTSVERNALGRDLLMRSFYSLGMEPVPSYANFVMVPLESEAAALGLTEALLRKGVIIRPLKGFGIPAAVRISVGTHEENVRLIEVLDSVRAEVRG